MLVVAFNRGPGYGYGPVVLLITALSVAGVAIAYRYDPGFDPLSLKRTARLEAELKANSWYQEFLAKQRRYAEILVRASCDRDLDFARLVGASRGWVFENFDSIYELAKEELNPRGCPLLIRPQALP